jgi:hypothetical protein
VDGRFSILGSFEMGDYRRETFSEEATFSEVVSTVDPQGRSGAEDDHATVLAGSDLAF